MSNGTGICGSIRSYIRLSYSFIKFCVSMGYFEVVHFWFLVFILVTLIISILSLFSFKNLFARFGLLKKNRREFYECGFKPVVQKPISFSIQFIIIIFFFLIYDIELIFSFPLVSTYSSHSLFDLLLLIFLYGSFTVSLIFDFDNNLTTWHV